LTLKHARVSNYDVALFRYFDTNAILCYAMLLVFYDEIYYLILSFMTLKYSENMLHNFFIKIKNLSTFYEKI